MVGFDREEVVRSLLFDQVFRHLLLGEHRVSGDHRTLNVEIPKERLHAFHLVGLFGDTGLSQDQALFMKDRADEMGR